MRKLGTLLLILFSLFELHGQAALTPVYGQISDITGAEIPYAKIEVRSGERIFSTTEADLHGHFRFSPPVGQYSVAITSQGFRPLIAQAEYFSAGSTQIELQVGSGGGVEVSPSPSLPTESTALTSNVSMPSAASIASTRALSWEMGVQAEGGVGLEDRGNFTFLNLGLHAGKVLTPQFGSGLLQSNFEYGVEVIPFWQSYTPRFQRLKCVPSPSNVTPAQPNICSAPYIVGGTYTGVSITPIQLRLNLTHGERFMPWIQGAGGVVWTNHKYPAVGNLNPADLASNGPSGDTSVWNFTPQFGIGAHYFVRSRRSIDFSANAVHISSASLGDKNPGVNASVQFSLGYSWWK